MDEHEVPTQDEAGLRRNLRGLSLCVWHVAVDVTHRWNFPQVVN